MLTTFERYQGCLIGKACGDALGADIEFLSLAAIQKRFGPSGKQDFGLFLGGFTDDTQMTLAIIDGFAAGPRPELINKLEQAEDFATLYAPSVARSFVQWMHKPLGGHRAPGGACLSGCHALEHNLEAWRYAGGEQSGGCGGIMRAAAYGMLFSQCGPSAIEAAWIASTVAASHTRMTHRHPAMGVAPAAAQAAGVAMGLRGASLEETVAVMLEIAGAHSGTNMNTIGMMQLALDRAGGGCSGELDPSVMRSFPAWRGDHALASALHILVCFPDDLVGAIRAAVNIDGDSDSLGAIVGALVGARTGLQGLASPQWHGQLEFQTELDSAVLTALKLSNAFSGTEGVLQ